MSDAPPDDRARRRGEALRANLHRRKAQARASRTDAASPAGDDEATAPPAPSPPQRPE